MRLRIALLGVSMLPLLGGVGLAQSTQSTDQRLDQFEQRLNQIESKYQSDLKARDEEITRLRDELTRVRQQQATGAPAPAATTSADEIEKTKQDILKDIETNHPSPLTLRTPRSPWSRPKFRLRPRPATRTPRESEWRPAHTHILHERPLLWMQSWSSLRSIRQGNCHARIPSIARVVHGGVSR